MILQCRRTFIIGVGCTAYTKPRGLRTTEDMALEASTKALLDAGITYDSVQAAYVGYCYGDSTSGQRALYNLGMTGIPITNVSNNCATGGTTVYQVNNLVKSGLAECAMALGFERMAQGSVGSVWTDRPSPTLPITQVAESLEETLSTGRNHGPWAPRVFANAGQEYFDMYGANIRHLAQIASKNHNHAIHNPYSQFHTGWSPEQVLASTKVCKQLTKYMCSPTSDGASCCLIASEDFVHRYHLENQAIEIVAQALTTDDPSTYESKSHIELVGYNMTKACADEVFTQAGFRPGEGRDQVGVIELHDCFAANELISYDALGLCAEGEAHKMVDRGDNTYGGKYVINASGGLEAKGHPLGATGIGMHFFIAMQLREWAGPMQAPGLFDTPEKQGKFGLVHNLGLGGATIVSLLRRPEFYRPGGIDGRDRLGYNHGHECRPVTMADVERVKAKKSSPFILSLAKL